MPGGLGSFLLITKQNLAQTYLSAHINGESVISASGSELVIAASYIIGDSIINEAILFNYLADKKIVNPNHIMSDFIEIAIPIIPQPIEGTVPPTPIEPVPPPPIIPPSQPPSKLVAIMKSYNQLTIPIVPALIREVVPPPPIVVAPPTPINNAIQKTYTKLTSPMAPAKIIDSRKPI